MVSSQVQLKVREFLAESFTEAKAINSRYSLRAFAKKVGVSPGALSEIMKGNRSISNKLVARIETRLELPPDFFDVENSTIEVPFSPKSLTLEQFAVLADPIHFSILALMETQDFSSDVDWMAHRLNRSKREVQSAIQKLITLDLVKNDGDQLISTGEPLESPDEVASRAIKSSHRQSLREAEAALNEVDLECRDFTTLTFAFNTQDTQKAKNLIRKFRREIEKLSQSGKSDEVYKLAIQFYPVTKLRNKKEESNK